MRPTTKEEIARYGVNTHETVLVQKSKISANRSSLIYNTSARHERCECNTSATQTTRVLHERRECDTSEKL